MVYTGRDQDRVYAGEDADVSYNLKRCIHAKTCVSRLPQVFDPDKRPWIQVGHTSSESLTAVIAGCPSGALHLRRKDGTDPEQTPSLNRITTRKDGPLYVTGSLTISASAVDLQGETRAALCRCGASKNKPFCDNSHRDVGFEARSVERPAVAEAVEGGPLHIEAAPNGSLHVRGAFSLHDEQGAAVFSGTEAYLCRCGGSSDKPFCDGTHKRNGFQSE